MNQARHPTTVDVLLQHFVSLSQPDKPNFPLLVHWHWSLGETVRFDSLGLQCFLG